MLLIRVHTTFLHSGLSVGEKALLWKIVNPQKFGQIASDLNASVLGGFTDIGYTFDVDSMISEIPSNTPCVLILPSESQGI